MSEWVERYMARGMNEGIKKVMMEGISSIGQKFNVRKGLTLKAAPSVRNESLS